MSESYITVYGSSSAISSRLITSNVSSVLILFHFFTWIALDAVDLHVSVILLTKAITVKGGATLATWLYHHRNQSIHVTWHDSDVTFCYPSNTRKEQPWIVYVTSR